MSHRLPKSLLALACSAAALSAAAQTTISVPTTDGATGTNAAAGGAATNAGAASAPSLGQAPTLSVSPGMGSAPSIAGAAAQSVPTAAGQAPAAPAQAAAVRNAPASAFSGAPALSASPAASVLAPEVSAPADQAAPARSPAADVPARAPRAPSLSGTRSAPVGAGSTLDGTARRISQARLEESAGGDEFSVSRALDKAFDASIGGPALRSAAVAGRDQGLREQIAEKIGIANASHPAEAPRLYLDAIQTAKDAAAKGLFSQATADAVARVVRSFAARKADVSLGDLATAGFQRAAARDQRDATGESGADFVTKRFLPALDAWENLLGAPAAGKPLITNAAELKGAVADLMKSAQAGSAKSAPHVWFVKKGGSFTAVLPGAGVAPVPALAAAFAVTPSQFAPDPGTVLSDAYRAFAQRPGARSGAGLVYRANRRLGASVPEALASAARFWLRAALESLWRRFTDLFTGRGAYDLSRRAGQDALRRDAALAVTARGEAAAAKRLLSSGRLTVVGARAAFAALLRSAEAYGALYGEDSAYAAVADLSRDYEKSVSKLDLRSTAELPADLVARFVSGPGAAAHWAGLIDSYASRDEDARLWRSRPGADSVDLGAKPGAASHAAALIRDTAGVPLATVALDDSLWARGRGANGEVRLSADLRATAAGGGIKISVEHGDAALERRLSGLGLAVTRDGDSLLAVADSEGVARNSEELAVGAARALAAALGREETSDGTALSELVVETRRDPASAASLAALFDGREAFAGAPVIGTIGGYEALRPQDVESGGVDYLVTALRDPVSGLLVYARAARSDGAPLGAAALRALLSRGR